MIEDNIKLTTSLSIIHKDSNFQYFKLNNVFMNLSQAKSPKQILGKTDDNLPWEEYAEHIRKIDQEVISGKSFILLEQFKPFAGERVFLYNKKQPIFNNNGEVTGINLTSKKIHGNFLLKLLNLITNDAKKFGNQKTCQYLIKDKFENLTLREMDCLFYLVRYRNIKLIGALLSISPRTVETHIEHIKQKLHCYTTPQLIDKAFSEGFISIIPKELILKQPIILDTL